MITPILWLSAGTLIGLLLSHVLRSDPKPVPRPKPDVTAVQENTVVTSEVEEEVEETREVTKEDPLKDISEPVLSMAQCIRNKPHRFKLIDNGVQPPSWYNIKGCYRYSVLDRITQRYFKVKEYSTIVDMPSYEVLFGQVSIPPSHYHTKGYALPNESWLTDKEEQYLVNTFKEVFEQRQDKVNQYKADKRRKKMMDLYCESGDSVEDGLK